jgi:three-Cys-motif partner protein
VTDPERFFEEAQPAAVLKHGILSRYLPVFAMRAGSMSPDNRVAYLDGYAGPGQYVDGTPGSPALAITIAETVVKTKAQRQIDGYLVEEDRDTYEQLSEFVAQNAPSWRVYHGSVEEHLDAILRELDPRTPLFAFLDPFGLSVPEGDIKKIMARGGRMVGSRRSGGSPTEVLLNFSYPGLRRNAGQLGSTSTDPTYLKARETILDRLDAVLGGDWWEDIWNDDGVEDRAGQILDEWSIRMCDGDNGWGYCSIPVSDRWMGPPSYALVLLSQHPAGWWHFHDALSLATEEYREVCLKQSGQLDLEPLAEREEKWVAEITQNIARLLEQKVSFQIDAEMMEVFGKAIDYAREKHVRAAVKRLFREGHTTTDGKGDVRTMVVRTPSARQRR